MVVNNRVIVAVVGNIVVVAVEIDGNIVAVVDEVHLRMLLRLWVEEEEEG